MTFGQLANYLQNMTLAIMFTMMGTVMLVTVLDRVKLRDRVVCGVHVKLIFIVSSWMFWLGAAWRHLQHAIYWRNLPPALSSVEHVIVGTLQIIGVVTGVIVYHRYYKRDSEDS